ncbi:uncharacterized protein [Aegilops tauschii subsp. strangulata]|uniref:uncharacterized protein n=1 Tax=Aegilops tauschii subsp. strangulata TaxID=200361 RepID=UPI001ABD0454|nr:uncharacterized protein LOC109749432 [Aegilops tauschii subsp. strangulata]
MEKQFLGLELQHVPRGTKKEADDIAKRASRRLPQEHDVFEERLFKPSAAPPSAEPASPQEELPQPPASGAPTCGPTSGARLLLALEPQEGCWTEESKAYLVQGTLPEKEEDAERVARQATAYCIQDSELEGGSCPTLSLARPARGLRDGCECVRTPLVSARRPRLSS